jgi:hypothetical protein
MKELFVSALANFTDIPALMFTRSKNEFFIFYLHSTTGKSSVPISVNTEKRWSHFHLLMDNIMA